MADAAAAGAAAAAKHASDAAADQQHVTDVKRPFWEAPDNLASGSSGGGNWGGGAGAAGTQQRGPVRLLRITVPPVEGRCKCGALLFRISDPLAADGHIANWTPICPGCTFTSLSV
jgi:hypothetical protein